MSKEITTVKDLRLYIHFQGLLLEWKLSRLSNLELPYDEGDSPYYEAAKRLGKPLNDIKSSDLKHREQEVWVIPNDWLEEQSSITEIKDNE